MTNSFASYYEMFNPLSTVAKSRFKYWFDGSVLDTNIWSINSVAGSTSTGMVDAIDEGYQFLSGVTGGSRVYIDFNQFRNFSNVSSVLIAEVRSNNTSGETLFGMSNVRDIGGTFSANQAIINGDVNNNANWTLQTGDGTTATGTSTGLAMSTSWLVFKLLFGASSVIATISGVNTTTNTTHLPTAKLQPVVGVVFDSGGAAETRIRYLEAYNI